MTARALQLCLPLIVLAFATARPQAGQTPRQNTQWPSFRGTNAGGVAEGSPLPVTWNVTTSENIRWKTRVPGLGLSSPIIWGNRIYLTTTIGGQDREGLKSGLYGDVRSVDDNTPHRWIVCSLDKETGSIVWETTAHSGVPAVKRHPKSTHANSTLATDGSHIVAFFGSEGVYCYDMEGKLLWSKNFGLLDSGYYTAPEAQWEFGSSPIIFENLVILQCDVQKDSFLAAYRIDDGSEVWRTPREDVPTWGTPAIYSGKGNAQVIVNGYRHIGGYDVHTGKEIWRMRGGGDIPVPTPVVAGDMVFITNAHGRMSPIYAVRLSATGDISLEGDQSSNGHVAWSAGREGSYMATPVVYGGYLYNCRWNGVLCCFEAGSGQRFYQERLGGGTSAFTASPVAGDGKVYLTSEDGDVYVVKAGRTYQLLANNSLGEVCLATPAISEGTLYFRTQSRLIAVANSK